jgi:hypothetical protein
MIRPLENQERSNPGEYINRINKPDPGHSAASRDFAYAVEEANRENPRKHEHEPGFGEDTYESAAEEEHPQPAVPEPEPEHKPDQPALDDRNLDVTV